MNSDQESTGVETPDHARVAFRPPVLLLFTLGTGFLLRWNVPLEFVPRVVTVLLGPIAVGFSLGLFVWAVYTMRSGGASIPTHQPTETIMTSGPFRFSRNPIYLSMLLLQLGIGIWANSFWFFGLAAVFAWAFSWGVISREEEYLEAKFGEAYLSYKTKARRWL